MGKKFSVILQKPKCLKCGRRLQVDRSETNYNAGKITAYRFNRQYHDGLVLKFKIESMISNSPTADMLLNIKQQDSEYVWLYKAVSRAVWSNFAAFLSDCGILKPTVYLDLMLRE